MIQFCFLMFAMGIPSKNRPFIFMIRCKYKDWGVNLFAEGQYLAQVPLRLKLPQLGGV